MIFPRDLSELEVNLLKSILPENKPGYKKIADEIFNLKVIGRGRFGGNNYVIGSEEDDVDLSLSSSPILAAGYKTIGGRRFYILLHEENEDKYEIDYQEVDEGTDYSFSDWIPGGEFPLDDEPLREVTIVHGKIMLAISKGLKRIWIHEIDSGINTFIPVANFYNEIMRMKNERNPEIALKVNRLFTNLNDFTDNDLISGFIAYNQYLKKLELPSNKEISGSKIKRKSLFNKLRGN